MSKYLPNISVIILLIIPFLNGCVGYNTIAKSESINPTEFKKERPVDGWESIPVYDDTKLFEKQYKVVATINVTGDQNSFDEQMIEKMQKEASRFAADAIIFKNWNEVERTAVNGFGIGLNILGIFNGDFINHDMGGKYNAYQYEGIAIQFLDYARNDN